MTSDMSITRNTHFQLFGLKYQALYYLFFTILAGKRAGIPDHL